MKRLLSMLCFLIIALLLQSGVAADRQTVFVSDVVDGDTLRVRIGDKKFPVRLIGIDAPESHDNRRADYQARSYRKSVATILELGQQSSQHLKSLVHRGDKISLEFDVERTDKYQRMLAYAYLDNGTMLNEKMIADGYAKLLTIPPNVRYEHRFLENFREARREGRGLWSK